MRWIRWTVACAALVALAGACGETTPTGGDAKKEVVALTERILDGLVGSDVAPLCAHQDLREHYAALPSAQRSHRTFAAFEAGFPAACAAELHPLLGPGRLSVVVADASVVDGRTVVRVLYRLSEGAPYNEWKLPFRRIEGRWRMGLDGYAALRAAAHGGGSSIVTVPGSTTGPQRESPAFDPPPGRSSAHGAPVPEEPPVSEEASVADIDRAEFDAITEARLHIARGGGVDDPLSDRMLLGWPAHNLTRLHVAAANGWTGLADFLLEEGADVEASARSKSHYNRLTPIDVAKHSGHDVLHAMLRRARSRGKEPEPPAETAAEVKTLTITFPRGGAAAALVSLDHDRVRLAYEEMEGTRVDDDLFVEPQDPDVIALTKTFGGLRHQGKDAAVAPVSTRFDALTRPPQSIPWTRLLPRSHTRVGSVFLVRSSMGRIYKVLLDQCDSRRFAVRYALLDGGAGAAPSSADERAVRTIAERFVRASRDGDVGAAARLCTNVLGDALRADPATGSHEPAISAFDVRRVTAAGARAKALVWVRNRALPAGQNEFELELSMVRVGADWRIDALKLAPYWKPMDLGPEVDR